MGGTEVVDMEPDILWPSVGNQVLISLKKLAWTFLVKVIRGGSRTLYFVLADVNVRRRLDDSACEVEDHLESTSLAVLECVWKSGDAVCLRYLSARKWHVKAEAVPLRLPG